MTRLGEICSIVAATFYQISRSAIKKYRQVYVIGKHARSSLLEWKMSARIITIPTIDILLEVESLPALDSLNDRMRDMGYTPRGENGIAGRRYYIKGNGKRTHHVHAFIAGSEQAI